MTEELCGTEFSKSTVSRLCQQLDPVVTAWNERPLVDQAYPFFLVDAVMLKVREEGRVRARARMIATGINEAGYREILGILLGDSESEAGWTELFVTLKQRGLQGVDLMVSDNHQGLVNALHAQFQGASWQRCQTHFVRNVWDVTPKAIKDEFHQQRFNPQRLET